MKKLFISHSSKDKEFASKITFDLTAIGFDVWMDARNISVGQSIVESIQNGLKESDFVILLISPESVKSNWVNKEWTSTIKKQIDIQRTKILPVLIVDTELPVFLDDLKFADMRTNYARGLAELVKAIYDNSDTGNDQQYFSTYDEFLKRYSLSELLDIPGQEVQFAGFTHSTTLFNYDDHQIIEWIKKSKVFEIFLVKPEHGENKQEESEKIKYYKKRFSYADLETVINRCKDILFELKQSGDYHDNFKVYLLDLSRVNLLNVKRIGNLIINRVIGFNQMGSMSPTYVYSMNSPFWEFFRKYFDNLKALNDYYNLLET